MLGKDIVGDTFTVKVIFPPHWRTLLLNGRSFYVKWPKTKLDVSCSVYHSQPTIFNGIYIRVKKFLFWRVPHLPNIWPISGYVCLGNNFDYYIKEKTIEKHALSCVDHFWASGFDINSFQFDEPTQKLYRSLRDGNIPT